MADETKEKNKKKAIKIIIMILLILLLLLMSMTVLCPFIADRLKKPDSTVKIEEQYNSVSNNSLKADPSAGEYVEPEAEETENGGVSVPGWSSLNIPADTSEVAVDFFNPEANKGKYSLTFELRIPDESSQGYEVLYSSGLVDAGLHIQKINLSRGLKAGVYDAIIHVQPYRTDDNLTATNNADLKTKLVVS